MSHHRSKANKKGIIEHLVWPEHSTGLCSTYNVIFGASVASPSLTSRRSARPRLICGYVCMYVCLYVFLYLGQQFGKRFRRLARKYVSLKGRNAFEDVQHVQRKTWILFSRRAMRIFFHGDASLVWGRDNFDRLPHWALPRFVPFEQFYNRRIRSSSTGKMREPSGLLLKDRKRQGPQGSSSASRSFFHVRHSSSVHSFDLRKTVKWIEQPHIYAYKPHLAVWFTWGTRNPNI